MAVVVEFRLAGVGLARNLVRLDEGVVGRAVVFVAFVAREEERVSIDADQLRDRVEDLPVAGRAHVEAIFLGQAEALSVRAQRFVIAEQHLAVGVPAELTSQRPLAVIVADDPGDVADGLVGFVREPAEVASRERAFDQRFKAGELAIEMEEQVALARDDGVDHRR